jgi:DNA-binding CsgD family transcriptional regulator
VLRLSDHLSRRELHRTELYDLVYSHTGLEYQLGIRLPPMLRGLGRPDEVVGLSLCRSDYDFGEGDRALLTALQPLFSATLAHLHELTLLRATAARPPSRDEAVLLVDAAGVVAWASPTAAGQFDLTVGERLPSTAQRWLAGAREAATPDASPTVLVLDGRQVWPRLVRDAYPELDAIHLLPAAASPCQPQELRVLGLTRRQSEVLALVMEGLTSREIAERLTLSPRTVETHTSAISTSLGVRNRSEALLATLQRLAA